MRYKTGYGYAHGKVILIGEHAVVYNHYAIALPLTSATLAVEVTPYDISIIDSPIYKGTLEQAPASLNPIVSLINHLSDMHHLPPLKITVQTNIPPHAGMGSSAAAASALIQAVYDLIDQPLDYETRFHLVQFSETIAHGNPSGIDARITMSQKAILFKRNEKPTYFDLTLKGFLVIGFSGVEGETKVAVQHIAKTMDTEETQSHIEALGNLTNHVILNIQNQALNEIGQALTKAHHHLKSLDISIDIIDDMVEKALSLNALGAKMTGGGLGGCVLALTDNLETAEAIQNAWENMTNISPWILDINKG